MISVQNHQLRSSGNRLFFVLILGVFFFLGACSPKTRVLKSPDHSGGNVGGTLPKEEKPEITDKEETAEDARRAEAARNSVTLVLPFQLDKIAPHTLSKEDVNRSAIALDFYQGFQLGLDELAQKGRSFSLNVVDSRDNELHNQSIARSEDVTNAALIVGPVFPKEITTFGTHRSNKKVLQVNPLAATKARDFNLPNLVSLTPSIDVHTKAMAKRVAHDYKTGDVVIIYNTSDNDGKQFLSGFLSELKSANSSVQVRSVSSIPQLNEQISLTGTNLVVAGTTDRFQLRSFVSNLEIKSSEEFYTFRVYGHPLWDRIDFSIYERFGDFQPVITTESHMKAWTRAAKEFKDQYYSLYGVNPSDYSYKGYDAARYFGNLLAKYGDDYPAHITKEKFEGLFSTYTFDYNEGWGFVNNAVSFKNYQGSSFQLK
ncbi:ABC transporter substrate-binding protein [Sphingobacterium corticibacterium]|uniref:Amino acid ABC transporter substrate-binding protein n=1 Tax=Sphingobacterium corticibacterium TaxID=2484746 RepID=A0A4Q6XNT3_9SPHI|nr:hypothetical protein [Sphingobacterium corticibacterium]RZF61830.1 hypothetical protein EWE74_03090 [Sphingobacterium corticibacterium]